LVSIICIYYRYLESKKPSFESGIIDPRKCLV
jgi:hypothetical protein